MKFYVNGAGFVFTNAEGPRVIEHGTVFDAPPSGWVPPPDSWLMFAMDAQAQSALAASIATQISKTGPIPPPGICELNPHPPIFAP